MTAETHERIRGLLEQGWGLLGSGRSREAADVFGRVLLQEPADAAARRGLAEAKRAVAEADRVLEVRLDEARRELDAGDPEGARALVESVLNDGGDPDRLLPLLDRADGRGGRLESSPARLPEPSETPPATRRLPMAWSRRALLGVWVVTFALLAGGATASWERLVSTLTRAPAPTSQLVPPALRVAAPTPGELAVAEARRLLDQGDAAAAVAALDRVAPQEPAYPFARQLRMQAESARRKGASPR